MEAPPPTVDLQADRSGLLIRANMVCAVLAGLAVAGRMMSRMMVKAGFGLSDFLLILGLICSWVIAGLGVWGKQHNDPCGFPLQLAHILSQRRS